VDSVYEIVTDLFSASDDYLLREIAVESKIIENILDRLEL